MSVDVETLTIGEIAKVREFIEKNNELLRKAEEIIKVLENFRYDDMPSFLTDGIADELKTAQSLSRMFTEQTAEAEEAVEKAEESMKN